MLEHCEVCRWDMDETAQTYRWRNLQQVDKSTRKDCSWSCRLEDSGTDIVGCGGLRDKGWEELQGYRKDFYLQD